jgi:hypothetical protein
MLGEFREERGRKNYLIASRFKLTFSLRQPFKGLKELYKKPVVKSNAPREFFKHYSQRGRESVEKFAILAS